MPSIAAKRKCPDLIFVKPRFDAYKAISLQIREIFAEYTPIIEPLSLDEAYLDVTENLKGIALATQLAEEIRAKIRAETGLTASAGVSYNKFLAKLASDHRKPDGLFVITPKMGPAFVETLPVRKFHGVGPATARKMSGLGIETGFDLKGQTLEFLQQHFGKVSSYYYWAARGVDERPVRADRIRKSVGAENTFPADLFAYEAARDALREIVDKVWDYCEGSGDQLPVVRYDRKAGERSLDMLRWGLVPYWAKDLNVGFANINAKAEGIETRPAFRDAFQRRRCLVLVDNFYEWKKTGTGKQLNTTPGEVQSWFGVYSANDTIGGATIRAATTGMTFNF